MLSFMAQTKDEPRDLKIYLRYDRFPSKLSQKGGHTRNFSEIRLCPASN